MRKILAAFGTRPEAIKMAPLIKVIEASSLFRLKICVTAQHREMLDGVLNCFGIRPHYDLDTMSAGQTVNDITVRVLEGMDKVLELERPDLVLVHGDTTTTMASALAAFYRKIPVGHVEAGLRSGNIYSPYPEEMNRRITSTLAALHFAPTAGNRKNLLDSGVEDRQIHVTGNTVIDALHMVARDDYIFPQPLLNKLDFNEKKVILLTLHRRENWGATMKTVFAAVRSILHERPDVELVFPVHMNPAVREAAHEILGTHPGAHLMDPLDYEPFVNLMARSYLVLTDSGGIQEEAPSLGRPVLVLRTETERPEALEAGTVKVAGVDGSAIRAMTVELLDNELEYAGMARAVNPYGDGKAADKILKVLENWSAAR